MICTLQNAYSQSAEEVHLILEISEVSGTQDEVIGSVIVDQFENMSAYQFSLQWDTDELEYLEIEYLNSDIGLRKDWFNKNRTDEGFLPTLWTSHEAECTDLDQGTVIFSVRFKRNVPTSQFIITPDPIGLYFYDCSGNVLDLYFTDNQGTTRLYSENTTNTVTHTTSGHFSVSPNPTTGRIHIQNLPRNPNDQYHYTLLSLLGNRLADGEVNGSFIDLPSHLPSGQYFLRISQEGVPLGTKRIVLTK